MYRKNHFYQVLFNIFTIGKMIPTKSYSIFLPIEKIISTKSYSIFLPIGKIISTKSYSILFDRFQNDLIS